ncbi:hypothetical protein O9929_17645 [Vibrio lentus]|nr:hypothetical protein [Vibrio lentus]
MHHAEQTAKKRHKIQRQKAPTGGHASGRRHEGSINNLANEVNEAGNVDRRLQQSMLKEISTVLATIKALQSKPTYLL